MSETHPIVTMALLKKHKQTLLVLTKARPKLVKEIIATADKSLIHALSECALNVLTGVVPLTAAKKRKLSKFKENLRALAKKKTSLTNKKRVLQSGGFISLLASVVAPLLFQGIGALAKHIKNKRKRR